MSDKPLREALKLTLEGLLPIILPIDKIDGPTSFPHLRWMCETALENLQAWPTDKTSRWIGFVQGVLAARGRLDVNDERDRTRPFFHEAYEAMSQNIPPTQERE